MNHLDLDAPPLARCYRCGRSTWSPSEVGTEDRMPQPDGGPCGGTLEAIPVNPELGTGELTTRQQGILKQLRFRRAGETQPERQVCWLGIDDSVRARLFVPDMMGSWSIWQPVRRSTMDGIATRGLIELGPVEPLPDYIYHRSLTSGQTVRLIETEADRG